MSMGRRGGGSSAKSPNWDLMPTSLNRRVGQMPLRSHPQIGARCRLNRIRYDGNQGREMIATNSWLLLKLI